MDFSHSLRKVGFVLTLINVIIKKCYNIVCNLYMDNAMLNDELKIINALNSNRNSKKINLVGSLIVVKQTHEIGIIRKIILTDIDNETCNESYEIECIEQSFTEPTFIEYQKNDIIFK